jgi:hypothetical protein
MHAGKTMTGGAAEARAEEWGRYRKRENSSRDHRGIPVRGTFQID